jgi:hypothetical protein
VAALRAFFQTQDMKGVEDNGKKSEKTTTGKLVSVELSSLKMQQLNRQPIIETNVSISEDGKWLMHKTVITDIKPVSYFEKVLER